MIVHNLKQGTPEWRQLRAKHFTASEAPAMMGCGYISRNDLLKQKALGIIEEPTPEQQRLYDRGHKAEARYRPIAAKLIGGGDLYPITASIEHQSLKLLASSDGVTMMGDSAFEHKLLNQSLVEMMTRDGEPGPKWYWQLEQQILVLGVERILFVTSDGTEENSSYCWYTSKPERRAALIAGWKQFAEDLASYKHQEQAPKLIGAAAVAGLPAIQVDVSGDVVVKSNFDEFRAAAAAFAESLRKPPETDQDFADAEANIKRCEDVEGRLASAREGVLARVSSIDQVVGTINEVSEMVRAARLNLEKLVKYKKDSIKAERIASATADLAMYVGALNAKLGDVQMPSVRANFQEAAKNKRTLKSLQDALDQELANAKTEANAYFVTISDNIGLLKDGGEDLTFLFPDLQSVCTKQAEDFANLLEQRRRQHAERIAATAAAAPVAPVASEPAQAAIEDPFQAVATAQVDDSGKTLSLGQINKHIAPISISSAGLAELGFEPVNTSGRAQLYRVADVPRMCIAIANRMATASRKPVTE